MEIIRPIAIHLPQFHPIPENDAWWGKGFTEWTNVTKAKPLFKEHYQPKLPADLGFYDLRLEAARNAQAALAQEYGIYGFCYYHYWFNGKKLLEQPVEEILKTRKPGFPFMLCWANENWTRIWDGGSKNILVEQHYTPEDDEAHIRYLLPFFKDPRYIRIDGKPVFAIYRSTLLPDAEATIQRWRGIAATENIELYIIRFEGMDEAGERYFESCFDAAAEFQPHIGFYNLHRNKRFKGLRDEISKETLMRAALKRIDWIKKKLGIYKQAENMMDEYQTFIETDLEFLDKAADNYKLYRCVCPGFDNTARRGNKSYILKGSTPELFRHWMQAEKDHFQPYSKEENLFFINAWNEWAEGNYLEPDIKWGRQYLEAVNAVFNQH